MNSVAERLYNGIVKENPTFVLMLGMCPTMAVTTSGINAVGMGLSTTVVLILSNIVISLLRKVIPDKVRIPAFIVIIASFVTIVEMLMQGYLPGLYSALGIYIPLIVVNCIILGRAESWAYKNGVLSSAFDGVGMGLGFTIGLTSIGLFRELIGAGTLFGFTVMPEGYEPVSIFIMAPGAFFVLACLIAVQNKVRLAKLKKGQKVTEPSCGAGCASCTNPGCESRFYETEKIAKKAEKEAKEEKKKAAKAAKAEAKAKAAESKKAKAEGSDDKEAKAEGSDNNEAKSESAEGKEANAKAADDKEAKAEAAETKEAEAKKPEESEAKPEETKADNKNEAKEEKA